MYIDVEDYRIVNEALEELHGELATQSQIAIKDGASEPPFASQLRRLRQIIAWGKQRLSENDDYISGDLSGKVPGYINAALQLAQHRLREKARMRQDEGRPEAVVAAILNGCEKFSKLEEVFPGPPDEILWQLIPPPKKANPDEASTHAFISYIRENEVAANRLAESLRKKGVEVWVDRDSIAPGSRWKREVRRAITEGAFFIACFSAEYSSREKTYMNEELTIAIEELRQRPADRAWFIPVMLSESQIPDRDIGAGETLRDIQWLELWKDWDSGIEELARALLPQRRG